MTLLGRVSTPKVSGLVVSIATTEGDGATADVQTIAAATLAPAGITTDPLGHTTVSFSGTFTAGGPLATPFSAPAGRFSGSFAADGSLAMTLNAPAGQTVVAPSGVDIATPTGLTIPDGGREEVAIEQRQSGDPIIPTWRIYDISGQLVDVYLPPVIDNRPKLDDGTTANPTFGQWVSPHWHYTYDSRGNQLTQTDPNGHTTSFAYDDQSRRISRTLPIGTATTGIRRGRS